jgi:biopolymer transport protein ExbD/biopolymer transport protein TolR
MAFQKTKRGLYSEMNITNLVDVIFALLIIFMITAPLMSQGVKVDLPKVDTKNIEVQDALHISITYDRKIYINEKKVSLYQFEREFRVAFPGRETAVVLNADRRVPYGFVVEIINSLQKNGVEKLSFLTELPAKEELR